MDKDEELAAILRELAEIPDHIRDMAVWIFDLEDATEDMRGRQFQTLSDIATELRFTVDRLKESMLRHGVLDVSRLHPSTGEKIDGDDEIPF